MLSKDNKSKTALSLNCGKIFLSAGFRCVEAISCPLTTQSADSREVERAKKNHRMLGRNRDLYVFRKVSTPSTVATGLKILCPRCLETLELIHQDKGKHSLRRVKQEVQEKQIRSASGGSFRYKEVS